tara:strand:+ start:6099 stop:7763 length:1665 start_codon:yes stop_codon:yes gene_type:complete
MYDLIQNIETCYYNVPQIIYYSHYGPALIAFMVGLFVFLSNRKSLAARLLLLLTTAFALWSAFDLVTWIGVDSRYIMFSWATLISMDMLIYVLSFYLLYVFLYKQNLKPLYLLILFAPLLPIIIFAPTTLNLLYFDTVSCNAIDGFIAESYLYTTELGVYLAMILTFVVYLFKSKDNRTDKLKASYFSLSLLLFLGIFLSTNSLASYYDTNPFLWSLTQYGLFGMALFVAVLGFLIVRYNAFNIKLLAAQALVISLISVVSSMFLFTENTTNDVMVGISLVLVSFGGYLLINSVKREVKQREELEKLTKQLEKANVRLKQLDKMKSEFVSIASHQLRSPITSIRGYASLILEGTYGKITKKMKEPLERIEQSSHLMAVAIEDYLNVSRIEAGNMKYNLSDFNLRDEVDNICDDIRPQALKRGLVLLFRTDLKSKGVVNADLGKTVQIVQNLITNSIKYTEKGSVTVRVWDDVAKKKSIYVDITDTGIGMSKETLETIFQKFERADNANSVNIHGTGLGLFVALKMAEAMGGTITAHSDGDGEGSRFTFELPLAL